MRFSIAAAAACVASTHAFKDTSPFVLLSSSPLPSSLQVERTQQLQSSSSVLSSAKEILAQCNDDIYIFVAQPGIRSSELSSQTPHLKKALAAPSVQGRYPVAEVVGLETENVSGLANYVRDECKATSVASVKEGLAQKKAGTPIYVQIEYTSRPGLDSNRNEALADFDAYLFSHVFNVLPKGTKFTVVVGTSPSTVAAHEGLIYEAEFQEPVHMDLKRNVLTRESKSEKGPDRRPLFEKYQYFTPGLFMGLLVTVLLLSILGVGISAISSLEVSYGAFDKEMGPAAQKKAQ
ncbi:hypothetical protein HYALB_00003497 [Hymenoscyphus albidus]|uniref:Protein BIG1 n=1 Tax=Hymenoscyphus albidus TaxID=595503 RepID=A0A9N9LQN1_9HELO|nr:hypothetical protein HYALB_00003497 [Hymenoscyphus albidus]